MADDPKFMVPYEKHAAKNKSLVSWINYLDGEALIRETHKQFKTLPPELSIKIYDYASPYLLPIINDDLKKLLKKHPEYTKEKPHLSLAILINHIKTNFHPYTNHVWHYLLEHNYPIKNLIETACKKTALSKIESYIDQLPNPVKEYAKNYAFFAYQWPECNREVLSSSITPLYITGSKDYLNTMASHKDTLYAINKEQNAIVVLNNKTLEQEKIIKIEKKFQQLVYDHIKNVFYIETKDYHVYRYNSQNSVIDLIRIPSVDSIEKFILNIDPQNQYLYLIHNSRGLSERIDLENNITLKFNSTVLERHKKYHGYFLDSSYKINTAKVSLDGKYLLKENCGSLFAYKIYSQKNRPSRKNSIVLLRDCIKLSYDKNTKITLLQGFKKRSFLYLYNDGKQSNSIGISEFPLHQGSDKNPIIKIPVLSQDGPVALISNQDSLIAMARIITTSDNQQINLFLPPQEIDVKEKQCVIKLTPKFNYIEAARLYKLETFNNDHKYKCSFIQKIIRTIIHKIRKTIGMFDTEGNIALECIAKR